MYKNSNLIILFLYRYFEDDDEIPTSSLEYIPAPGSPSYDLIEKKQQKRESDSDEDPLDAFMASIEEEIKKNTHEAEFTEDIEKEERSKGFRQDIDGEDNEESYYR